MAPSDPPSMQAAGRARLTAGRDLCSVRMDSSNQGAALFLDVLVRAHALTPIALEVHLAERRAWPVTPSGAITDELFDHVRRVNDRRDLHNLGVEETLAVAPPWGSAPLPSRMSKDLRPLHLRGKKQDQRCDPARFRRPNEGRRLRVRPFVPSYARSLDCCPSSTRSSARSCDSSSGA